jgi:hypothetical protein
MSERETYQTSISQHDNSIMWIYYTSIEQYEKYHRQASAQVFRRRKEIQTIIHRLEGGNEEPVIAFEEREKQ